MISNPCVNKRKMNKYPCSQNVLHLFVTDVKNLNEFSTTRRHLAAPTVRIQNSIFSEFYIS